MDVQLARPCQFDVNIHRGLNNSQEYNLDDKYFLHNTIYDSPLMTLNLWCLKSDSNIN